MNDIVITGASGYVGSALKKILSTQFKKVVGIYHHPSQEDPDGVLWDISKPTFPHMTLHEPIIIHTAASIKGDHETLWNVNVTGTKNVCDWAVQCKAKCIIYFSTGGVYGYHADRFIAETEPLNPIGYYGYTKLIGEQITQMINHVHQIPFIILRLYFPFDDHYQSGIFNFLINAILTGKSISLHKDGKPQINPIHLEDIHSIVTQIITCPPQSGIYNLCGDSVTSIEKLVTKFEQKLNKKAVLIRTSIEQNDLLGDNSKLKQAYHWLPKRALHY